MSGKIENLGSKAQKDCIKMHVEGQSYNSIALQLSSEYNTDITKEMVEHFLERQKRKIGEEISKDKSGFQDKLVQSYWDTISQLKNINSEMYSLFLDLRKNPEQSRKIVNCPKCRKKIEIEISNYASVIKSANTLLEEIKHVDEILHRISRNKLTINISVTDMSKKISYIAPRLMESLEKQHIIKIVNKKRFRQRFPNSVEFSKGDRAGRKEDEIDESEPNDEDKLEDEIEA